MKPNKFSKFMEKFLSKFLIWAFSFCWLMIVFKSLHIGFMKSLSWWSVLLPFLFFLLTAFSYIIMTLFWERVILAKPKKLTHKQKRIVERRFKIAKEETLVKKQLRTVIIVFLSILIAYLILC